MLDHLAVPVSDLAHRERLYTAALAPLGYRRIKSTDTFVGFGVVRFGKSTDPSGDFWISTGPPNAVVAHFASSAASRAPADAFFAAGMAVRDKSNGAPSLRPNDHAHDYAAFVLDPDGSNIEAVCHVPA